MNVLRIVLLHLKSKNRFDVFSNEIKMFMFDNNFCFYFLARNNMKRHEEKEELLPSCYIYMSNTLHFHFQYNIFLNRLLFVENLHKVS